jgi:hypothetical protein
VFNGLDQNHDLGRLRTTLQTVTSAAGEALRKD